MSREEKLYVLRHTPRQEPQGQESKSWQQQQRSSCRSCHRSGSVNRLESGPILDQSSSCRTLIIHGSLSDESWTRYVTTPYPYARPYLGERNRQDGVMRAQTIESFVKSHCVKGQSGTGIGNPRRAHLHHIPLVWLLLFFVLRLAI